MSLNLTGSNDTVEATDALYRTGKDEDQMTRGSLSMAYYGVASAMFFVYIGAALAMAYGTVDALIGLALTIVAYGVFNMVLAKYSLTNRSTVAQFSRVILGTTGSAIATVIFALVAIYYAVFEGSIVAYAFQAAFGGPWWLWCLVVVIYSTPLVVGGVRRFLDRINGILFPVYLVGLATAVIWAGVQYGFNDNWMTHSTGTPLDFVMGGPGWLATFASYMGIWILMMFTMDYAAVGKRVDTKFHQVVTFGPVFYLLAFGVNGLVGIFLTFTIPGAEASETGIAGGIVSMMGLIGLLFVIVSQTRINTANYFLGSANLKTFGEGTLRLKLPNIAWVLITSAIIFLLMLLPIVQYLLLALAWQGVLVTGWVAIALTHIVMDRNKQGEHGFIGDRYYHRFNVAGVVAWAVATVLGIVILQGSFAWGGTWGPLLTAIVGSLLYAVLRTTMKSHTALKPEAHAAQSASESKAHQNA